eukprot:763135-Hanusia_phi.AAC.2
MKRMNDHLTSTFSRGNMLKWKWELLCSFLSDYPSSACSNVNLEKLEDFSSLARRVSVQTSEMSTLTVAELTGYGVLLSASPAPPAHFFGCCRLGVTLGIVHVLSGPDHISAMVTLSAGGSFRALPAVSVAVFGVVPIYNLQCLFCYTPDLLHHPVLLSYLGLSARSDILQVLERRAVGAGAFRGAAADVRRVSDI